MDGKADGNGLAKTDPPAGSHSPSGGLACAAKNSSSQSFFPGSRQFNQFTRALEFQSGPHFPVRPSHVPFCLALEKPSFSAEKFQFGPFFQFGSQFLILGRTGRLLPAGSFLYGQQGTTKARKDERGEAEKSGEWKSHPLRFSVRRFQTRSGPCGLPNTAPKRAA